MSGPGFIPLPSRCLKLDSSEDRLAVALGQRRSCFTKASGLETMASGLSQKQVFVSLDNLFIGFSDCGNTVI